MAVDHCVPWAGSAKGGVEGRKAGSAGIIDPHEPETSAGLAERLSFRE